MPAPAQRSAATLLFAYLQKAQSSANNPDFTALINKELPGHKWTPHCWHHHRSKIRRGDYDHRLPAGVKETVINSRRPPQVGMPNVTPPNRLPEVERKLAECLARVAHFLSPKIVREIATRNVTWAQELKRDFPDTFDHSACFYKGSASAFGPVRRQETKQERVLASHKFHPSSRVILDLNWFPRQAVSFICTGSRYTPKRWKKSGLSAFELAHILPHKATEVASISPYFANSPPSPYPIGLFTCVANVALIPKGMAKPTDVGGHVRLAFFHKYFEFYGDAYSAGFSTLRIPAEADWIKTLPWSEDCVIEPSDWTERVELLDTFRRRRLRALLKGETDAERAEDVDDDAGIDEDDSGT